MNIDITIETPISTSIRAAQVSSMFDVPAAERATMDWHGTIPIEAQPWHVGLIVGPSGAGKSTILNRCFGVPVSFEWPGASVLDDFGPDHTVDELAAICQAVGFNTIPAWLRPYGVLSNGERFRVDLARRLIEGGPLVVCDEFTSVVDRQVAQIGAHAVQKYIRRQGRQFVAATCHYDLEEWLQPDWILEPATMSFRWRSVQRRPPLACTISRVPHDTWNAFARFHYLTADLHRNAHVYVLSVNGEPAACAAVIFRPHASAGNIYGMSRLVTLPDFQGLGLAFALADRVAAAYKAIGRRYHAYPAHPSLIRSFNRSPVWDMERKPGMQTSSRKSGQVSANGLVFGGRPCAMFAYCGPAWPDRAQAEALIT
jgi:ABC-type lipoprotein export system ATPase subunit/GNAT superfamily N-acetyltransferase